MEQIPDFSQFTNAYGLFFGFFTYMLQVIAIWFYNNHNRLLSGASYAAWVAVNSLVEWRILKSRKYVQNVTRNVSKIYTNMYEFAEIGPIRVQISLYEFRNIRHRKTVEGHGEIGYHMGRKQIWTCSILHEVVFRGEPVKSFWQRIEIDKQHQEYLVGLMANESDGQYITDVQQMNDGDYKYLLMSEEAKTVFNIVLLQSKKIVYVLTLMLNREPPLEQEELSKIRLHAKNIRPLL